MNVEMRRARRIVVLATLCAAGFASAVTLENEAMRITFGAPEEAFAVREIVNKKAGNASFLHPTRSFPAFWGIRFVRKDAGTNVFVHVSERRTAAAREVKEADGAVTFLWKGLTLPDSQETFDVAARVKLLEGDAMSEWSVQVRNRSERWTLYSVQYPFLDRIVTTDDPAATVLAPAKGNVGGQLHKMSEYGQHTKLFSFEYPSDRLQMCALMTGEAGVYVAAHDPECRAKIMTVAPDGTVWFETTVENAGIPGKASGSIGYTVTVGCFRGDWWTAAHLYRDWALRQRWAAKGKIAFRADYPKKPLDTHIWIIGGGHTNSAAYTLAKMDEAWPDVGKNLTWSEWTAVGGGRATNRNNPEFFPAFEGTGDLSARASKAGFLTTLYVNGRIWDKATCGFQYARMDATKKMDGSLHNEDYHSWDTVFHFAVMCPTCPTWQKVLKDLSVRCLDELHMDGVYFDQVACSGPKECYDATHGHPLGGGRWWEQGYREMFTEIRREFTKRGAAIISEQMGEMWLDLIDIYLNALNYTPYDVPLFPAVYSGYMLHYGRPVPLDCDPDTAFREYARTLVWGEAFGWIVPYVLWIDRYRDRVSLIHRMACLRRDWKEFLVLGTLEDEVRLPTPDPDIFGTVYKNASGDRMAAFVVNAGKTAKTVRFRFPGADAETAVELEALSVKRVLR